MPGPLRTEAIVLRSIRYGEADRILHLYTPHHGRVSAIAKGARRARSRFGARLEPFFHVRAVLHEGRSELLTVTAVDTIAAHGALREHAATLDAAARACDAVTRLFETADPHPEVFQLLANELRLLHTDAAQARPGNGLGLPPQAPAGGGDRAPAGRLRGVRGQDRAPERLLRAPPHGRGLHAPAEAGAFSLSAGRLRLPRRRARSAAGSGAPDGSELTLRQVERAIGDTAEHHAHVRLRPLLAA